MSSQRTVSDRFAFVGRRNVTAEELLAAGDIGPCELVRGEVVLMTPAGCEHGRIIARLARRLQEFVEGQNLGIVMTGDPGFVLARNPDVVRGPDIAFVRRSRIASAGVPSGYWEGAPDLAVEVVSPGDRWSEVQEKIREYLAAGTPLVIVVDPGTRTAQVHRTGAGVQAIDATGELDGGAVLPGFRLPLGELLGAS